MCGGGRGLDCKRGVFKGGQEFRRFINGRPLNFSVGQNRRRERERENKRERKIEREKRD